MVDILRLVYVSFRSREGEAKTLVPYLKWVGGKRQLLPVISEHLERSLPIRTYVEPFVGGGAVLFDVLTRFRPERVYLSDQNSDLIDCYLSIRDNVESFIECLKGIEGQYNALSQTERRTYYLHARKVFNEKKDRFTRVQRGALFVFMVYGGFNGLVRYNTQGAWNVPHGKHRSLRLTDEANLREIHKSLQGTEILCADYAQSLSRCDSSTFVYLDPPYRPISQTSSFRSYTQNGFSDDEQVRLAKFCDELTQRGAKFLQSNSYSRDGFFETLYQNYHIHYVSARRTVNSVGSGRGEILESMILNF